MPRRVMLVGYYGSDNFGDEAILSTLWDRWSRLFPDLLLTVLASDAESLLKKRLLPPEVRLIQNTGKKNFLGEVRESIWDSDLVVIGGGGIFNDIPLANLFAYGSPVWLARVRSIRTMGYALGVGPLRTWMGQRIASATARMMNVITVRDEDSYRQMIGLGARTANVHLTADPCVFLSDFSHTERYIQRSSRSVRIGVFPRTLPRALTGDGRFDESVFRSWISLVERISSDVGAEIDICSLNAKDDDVYCEGIYRSLRATDGVSLRKSSGNINEVVGTVKTYDVCIGMRLHSLITSLACHVPYIGIAYQPKVSSFMSDTGMNEYAIGLSDFGKTEIAVRKVIELLDSRSSIRDRLSRVHESQVKKAELSESLMRDLLW